MYPRSKGLGSVLGSLYIERKMMNCGKGLGEILKLPQRWTRIIFTQFSRPKIYEGTRRGSYHMALLTKLKAISYEEEVSAWKLCDALPTSPKLCGSIR